jgi:predicted secreted protein
MQRVYGEFDILGTTSENIVEAIKDYETNLGLNKVPENLKLRKLGIKVDAACDVAINGRDFSVNEKEPLEFGYDTIKVDSIVFKTTGINAIVRYMYFREDRTYQ